MRSFFSRPVRSLYFSTRGFSKCEPLIPHSAFRTPHSLDRFRVIDHRLAFSQRYVSLLKARTASLLATSLFHFAFVLNCSHLSNLYVKDLLDRTLDIDLGCLFVNPKRQYLAGFAVC